MRIIPNLYFMYAVAPLTKKVPGIRCVLQRIFEYDALRSRPPWSLRWARLQGTTDVYFWDGERWVSHDMHKAIDWPPNMVPLGWIQRWGFP